MIAKRISVTGRRSSPRFLTIVSTRSKSFVELRQSLKRPLAMQRLTAMLMARCGTSPAMQGRRLLLVAASAMLLAGCATPLAGGPPLISMAAPSSPPRVVVALVDTGIQPFHEAFRLPPHWDTQWIQSLPNVTVVSAGFREKALSPADWQFEKGQLYWFEGTRVLAASLNREVDEAFSGPNRPIWDEAGHGTITASIVAQASPNAFIVMAEASSVRDSLEWVRDQPWIDVVSMSIGAPPLPFSVTNAATPGGYPPPGVLHEMVLQGKMVFQAAGNEPILTVPTEEGLPWVVAVGSADAVQRGTSPFSRVPPDFVANETHDHVADRDDLTGYRSAAGTSVAAPLAASVASEVVYALRAEVGQTGGITDGALVTGGGRRVTESDLRDALNASAMLWGSADYRLDLARASAGDVAMPLLPEADGVPVGPWVQMGWGWLGEPVVGTTLDFLRGTSSPSAKPEAAAYMEAAYGLREAYWDLPVHGPSSRR